MRRSLRKCPSCGSRKRKTEEITVRASSQHHAVGNGVPRIRGILVVACGSCGDILKRKGR
jgi:uncharacterized Zn finger protein